MIFFLRMPGVRSPRSVSVHVKNIREKIPSELPNLLKELAIAVLTTQPRNVYRFAAEFFEQKIADSRVVEDDEYVFNELALVSDILGKFRSADDTACGYLDKKRYKDVLDNLDMDLSKDQIRLLYMESDSNADCMFEYEKLVPNIAGVIKEIMVHLKRGNLPTNLSHLSHLSHLFPLFKSSASARALIVKPEDADYMIRGIHKVEMEEILRSFIKDIDKAGTGRLKLEELRTLLNTCQLHFPRSWTNILWMEAEFDSEGTINIEDFIKTCHALCTWMVTSDIAELLRDESVQALPGKLLQCCRKYDPDGTGRIRPNKLVLAIRDADAGVSLFQTLSIIGEAKLVSRDSGDAGAGAGAAEYAGGGVADDPQIEYGGFVAEEVVPILTKLLTEDTAPVERRDALTREQLDRASAEAQEALGMTRTEFVQAFNEAVAAAGGEASAAGGAISAGRLREALQASALDLADRQILMSLAAAQDAYPPDSDVAAGGRGGGGTGGMVRWEGLAERVLEVIMWEARLDRVYNMLAAAVEGDVTEFQGE